MVSPAEAVTAPMNGPYGADGAPMSTAEGLFGNGAGAAAHWYHAWAKGEYLLWVVKNGNSTQPLVVSGTIPFGAVPGVPGAVTLFGGNSFDFGHISGARAEVGVLLPGTDRCGIEADGIILPKRTISVTAGSGSLGIPVLGEPFFNELTQTTDSLLASSLSNPGGMTAFASTEMWSAEANVFVNFHRGERFTWNAMLGFRFLSLEETISVAGTRFIGSAGQTFESNPLPLGARTAWEDKFQTANRFYGVNFGATAEYRWRRFAFDGGVQVALGDIRRTESVNGFSQVTTGTGVNTVTTRVPGGLLTQITNIKTTQDDVFSVVPELRLDINYQLTEHVRIGAGYSIVYVSNVIRPGMQIDPVVNPTLVPLRTEFGLPLGTARPMQVFHGTDYWAQGVNFTVTLLF
jgi:hypothetical protein